VNDKSAQSSASSSSTNLTRGSSGGGRALRSRVVDITPASSASSSSGSSEETDKDSDSDDESDGDGTLGQSPPPKKRRRLEPAMANSRPEQRAADDTAAGLCDFTTSLGLEQVACRQK